MKHIILGLSLIAVFAFFMGCGGNKCEDLADELCDLYCGCGEDDAAAKAVCDACNAEGDDDDDDDDAECTTDMEDAAQKLVDDFECPGGGGDDDDDTEE